MVFVVYSLIFIECSLIFSLSLRLSIGVSRPQDGRLAGPVSARYSLYLSHHYLTLGSDTSIVPLSRTFLFVPSGNPSGFFVQMSGKLLGDILSSENVTRWLVWGASAEELGENHKAFVSSTTCECIKFKIFFYHLVVYECRH